MSPLDRFALDRNRVRFLPPNEANDELFFVEEDRHVRADNTFSFKSICFEAPRHLPDRTIQVRFQRKDPTRRVIVYYKAERMGQARPLDPVANDRPPHRDSPKPGSSSVELAPLVQRQEPSPFSDYQINIGWVAFTRLGTEGQLQVWTRSPTGQETQLTFYGDSSRITALAPNGQVMFLHGRRYLSIPGHQALEMSFSLGNPFWQGTSSWATIGRSVFRVNTAALPTISELFTTTAGQFGFQVSAAEGQTVITQASADLIVWENLQTNTVASAGFIFKDDASATIGHRFYRVVTP